MKFYGISALRDEYKRKNGNALALNRPFSMISSAALMKMLSKAPEIEIDTNSPSVDAEIRAISQSGNFTEIEILDAHNYYHRLYAGSLSKDVGDNYLLLAKKFIMATISMIDENKYFAVATESPVSWRFLEYPQYKAGRKEKEAVLEKAMMMTMTMLPLFGVRVFQKPLYEADDVAASLAKNAIENGISPTIISSDKDFIQLFDRAWGASLKIRDPFTKKEVSSENYTEKIDAPIGKILMYMGMVGDSSDNLPGVRGIGPKKASEIVKKYDNYDQVETDLQTEGLAKTARWTAKMIRLEDELFCSDIPVAKASVPPNKRLAADLLNSIPALRG